ncbi:DegV family protein [Rossellomorea aquimaris]|uniref:DegV family protein n=1 Tax=Rossellomorea aquimaris TaxID=189382 RepID=UPI001CD3B4CD|nr:DegV family protein [Rossellomorea aquimaris]MCA1054558.1 DegV family protein [Rossellomorea aquimaris]
MKIAWVTDSTAFIRDLTSCEDQDIFVVPMNIVFGDKEYKDGLDLTPEQLFAKLKEEKVEVKTSQPSIGTFKELYESLAERYDHIFSIHVSSHFSGTFSSAYQAAEILKDEVPFITCIDSKTLTYPLTELIEYGQLLHAKGKTVEEIQRLIEEKILTREVFVMVGSLEQLHKSGRMNGLSFFLGSMLSIKPILSIIDGQLEVKDKVRSIPKGLSKMERLLKEALESKNVKRVSILHGLNHDEASEWKAELEVEHGHIKFGTYPLGAVIGVHAGENTIGISWSEEIED